MFASRTTINEWSPKQGFEAHSAIDISARKRLKPYFGAHGVRETPVPIPNTEVKPSSGDYTATSGKLARCRIIRIDLRIGGLSSYLGILAIIIFMNTLADNTPSLPVMLVYGLVILLYLVILRLLINFLQQLSDKHHHRQSIIDRAIHQMHSSSVDWSMQAFDPYNIAIVILKAVITIISLAAAIVLLVTKIGYLATTVLLVMVIIIAWAANRWLKSREKVGVIREIRGYIQKAGSTGSVIALSISLVLLLFVMVSLH